MRITAAEYRELQARRGHGVAQLETVARRPSLRATAIWLPGKLVNTKQKGNATWKAVAGYERGWRRRAFRSFDVAILTSGWAQAASTPKRVTFLCRVFNRFDGDDGLRVAVSPIKDALQDAGFLNTDADRSGHRFDYRQMIERRLVRGVTVVVHVLADLPEPLGEDALRGWWAIQ